jgi:transcriptional regulator with XRE-family HTH domain
MKPQPWTEFRILLERSTLRKRDLAKLIGVSESHLSNLEAGRRLPTLDLIAKIAAALDVPISMLAPQESAAS